MRFRIFACLAGMLVLSGATLGAARALSTDADQKPPRLPAVSAFTRSIQTTFGGRLWRAGRAVNHLGEICVDFTSAGGSRAGGCLPPDRAFGSSPILPYHGGTEEVGFVFGAVSTPVQGVKLVRADCSAVSLPVSADGVFLSVFKRTTAPLYKIIGFDRTGAAVSSRLLHGRGTAEPSSGAC
jgi:hypothetical protein